MTTPQAWMIWPENPALSILILAVLGMAFLYAARRPVHQLLHAVGGLISGPLRMGGRWLGRTSELMRQRNKAVLLAHGRQEVGTRIEREFERLEAMVRRDLQGYPTLQRKLLDEITKIEEDYRKCGEVPPPSPDWVEAVAAVANIKSGSEMVQTILEEIKGSVSKMHEKTLGEYRRSYETRHRILEGFMPFWRSVDKTLTAVDKKIAELQNSTTAVDAQMAKYEAINARTDKAEQMLTVSAFTQFAVALLVMTVAAGGAFINFKLIALPMSEMVGAGDYLTSSLRTSEVAALVIILVEASMGLFLMEGMRITHLFPSIAGLSDRLRRRLMWVALVMLVTLAGIEAALALMRDILIADKQALLQSLAAAAPTAATDGWVGRIPTIGQMLLGFILPLALAFIAIPLETLIHSSRTVGGVLLAALVDGLALLLRIAANIVRRMARVAITLYDVAIVVPLLVEHFAKAGLATRRSATIDVDDSAHQVR